MHPMVKNGKRKTENGNDEFLELTVRTALKLLELKKEQGVRVTLAFEWQQLIERRLPGCPMEVRERERDRTRIELAWAGLSRPFISLGCRAHRRSLTLRFVLTLRFGFCSAAASPPPRCLLAAASPPPRRRLAAASPPSRCLLVASPSLEVPDAFRNARLYTRDVDTLFKERESDLRKLFARYSNKHEFLTFDAFERSVVLLLSFFFSSCRPPPSM